MSWNGIKHGKHFEMKKRKKEEEEISNKQIEVCRRNFRLQKGVRRTEKDPSESVKGGSNCATFAHHKQHCAVLFLNFNIAVLLKILFICDVNVSSR